MQHRVNIHMLKNLLIAHCQFSTPRYANVEARSLQLAGFYTAISCTGHLLRHIILEFLNPILLHDLDGHALEIDG
jgi:hypothetical protein